MHKVTTSNFEIDLSSYNISIQEENSWFSDTFFTKYSYPFDLVINGSINQSLGDILSFDSQSSNTIIPCKYVLYNKIENAELIIEQIVEDTASVSLKYGMDEFPNFDKNLNELDLEHKEVQNIYAEAEQNISKTYPETNYNFPQIHTDKFDPDSVEFSHFQKIINNCENGIFLTNTVEVENGEDIMYNRNIIQPLPYLMYLLKKCFQYSGLELKGDITQDPLLETILVFAEKNPFVSQNFTPLELSFYADELTDGGTGIKYIIARSVNITQPGKYNILGEFGIIGWGNGSYPATFKIFQDNVLLYLKNENQQGVHMADLDFILQTGSCEIKIEIQSAIRPDIYSKVFDFQILPIYFINSQGEKETNLLNENKIDLKKNVPNMTIGAFINNVLNMFNYDVDYVTSTEIHINRIEQSIQKNEIYDLSKFENINITRKHTGDMSFLLKYDEEGDVDLGGFYIDKKETRYVTKEFNKQVQNSINIPVYPLQNELIGSVFTAKSVQSSEDKLCFVVYNGLVNGNNYTIEPTALAIPNLVSIYHDKWLRNRVNSVEYNITFIASIKDVVNLDTKKRGHFCNNIHLFKNITKNQLKNELFEVEIVSETLTEL